MKKILILLFITIFVSSSQVFSAPKKIKCNKPIYFFENVRKETLFVQLDQTLQAKGYEMIKFNEDLGYIVVNYKVKKEIVPVALTLKTYTNDVYLFIDIEKSKTQLEEDVYLGLKPLAQNSYLLRDDYFCKGLTKDAHSLIKTKKPYLKETPYNPGVYTFDMKRYVGYDKKTYFWKNLKSKFKKKKKNEKI